MEGAVTWNSISWVVGVGVGVAFICCGILWKFYELISELRKSLADHKLEIAEKYVTKQGMQEQTGQMLRAIESLGNRFDSQFSAITSRLDLLYQNAPSRRSRNAGE